MTSDFSLRNIVQSGNAKTNIEHQLPQLILCEDCIALGYCKDAKRRLENDRELQPPFNIKNYLNLVPLNVGANYRINEATKKFLQNAYDAFHQDDFETALMNFKAAGDTHDNDAPISFMIAVTYFMLHDYEQAARYMQEYNSDSYMLQTKLVDSFLVECSKREKMKNSLGQSKPVQPSTAETKGVIRCGVVIN